MSAEDEVDRDLDDMTGDPAVTRQLKASLQRLRSGAAGPELAEMARDVLDGNLRLRDVTRGSGFAGAMTNAMNRLSEWNAGLTEEERESLSAVARSHVEGA
jgi:hypothetical protein